jgi:hypothetical protein
MMLGGVNVKNFFLPRGYLGFGLLAQVYTLHIRYITFHHTLVEFKLDVT